MFGAGAVGGLVGGRLFEAGHDVVLVARGDHLSALQTRGLQLVSEGGQPNLPIPVVASAADVDWRDGDVVLLSVKTQHTPAALDALAAAAPIDTPVVCLQNGVANEALALRVFPRVHAALVLVAAVHLEPGVVLAFQWPESGILDIGRYPNGVDDTASDMAEAWRSASFRAEAREDVMPWKRRKLLMNLANGLDVVCGFGARRGDLATRLEAEGERVMAAAGWEVTSSDEFTARSSPLIRLGKPQGRRFPGSSTWQSAARGTGDTEVDYLNGEIVLQGRLHGVETPVNSLLQRLTREVVSSGRPPGEMSEQHVLALLDG